MHYQLNDKFVIYFYGNDIYLYDTKNYYGYTRLNEVEGDILLWINKLHDIDQAWIELKKEYQIGVNEETQAKSLLFELISEWEKEGVLEEGTEERYIYGEYGKCYPLSISIELTNKCNFRCTHCYKEAGNEHKDFMEKSLFTRIMNDIRGKVYCVEITGGEATLHPDLLEMVKSRSVQKLILLTNGSKISTMNEELINYIDGFQITLYGRNVEEYKRYAQTSNFEDVCNGIRRLVQMGKKLGIAIILRKSNIDYMEEYIELLEKMGVRHISFGLASPIGRNEGMKETDWNLSEEDCIRFDVIRDNLQNKYKDMQLGEFDWRELRKTKNSQNLSYSFQCDAGTRNITVSEKGVVRPCIYMPEEYFGMVTWSEYIKMVSRGESVDYKDCILRCKADLEYQGKSIFSICEKAFRNDIDVEKH